MQHLDDERKEKDARSLPYGEHQSHVPKARNGIVARREMDPSRKTQLQILKTQAEDKVSCTSCRDVAGIVLKLMFSQGLP